MSRHKRADIAAKHGYFLDQPGADKRVGFLWHHENGFNLRIKLAVHERQLKFKLKIRYRPQAAYDGLARPALNIIHQQARKGIHLHIGQVQHRPLKHGHALLQSEHRAFLRARGHGHNHPVKQPGRTMNQIEVAIGRRVKAAGINRRPHALKFVSTAKKFKENTIQRLLAEAAAWMQIKNKGKPAAFMTSIAQSSGSGRNATRQPARLWLGRLLWLCVGALCGALLLGFVQQRRQTDRLKQQQASLAASFDRWLPRTEQALAALAPMREDLETEILSAGSATSSKDIRLSVYRGKLKRLRAQLEQAEQALRQLGKETAALAGSSGQSQSSVLESALRKQADLEKLAADARDDLRQLEVRLDLTAAYWGMLVAREAEEKKEIEVEKIRSAAAAEIRQAVANAQQKELLENTRAILSNSRPQKEQTFIQAVPEQPQPVIASRPMPPSVAIVPATYHLPYHPPVVWNVYRPYWQRPWPYYWQRGCGLTYGSYYMPATSVACSYNSAVPIRRFGPYLVVGN